MQKSTDDAQTGPAMLAREFLDAYADIEKVLRGKNKSGSRAYGLRELIALTRGKDSLVRKYETALIAFSGVRNAISHSAYKGGLPIAVPLRETVDEITRIRDQFEKPTQIFSCILDPDLLTASPQDTLRETLTRMTSRAFSQLPVYEAGKYVGLFTTNAVARWLASQIDETGDLLIEDSTVGGVLEFAEGHERAVHVARRTPVATVIETMMRPDPPVALIVTDSGGTAEKPLGVFVSTDLAYLLNALPTSST